MKLFPTKLNRRHGASMLIHCLVFMAAWLVIGAFAIKALFTMINGTTRLRATGNDIVAAMSIGERWRADIRAATGPVTTKVGEHGTLLEIPQGDHAVVYLQEHDELVRQHADGSRSAVVLRDVADTKFMKEQRGPVSAWRWELELKPNHSKNPSMKPLFTFLAVTGSDSKS
jgi:hypothetical protein